MVTRMVIMSFISATIEPELNQPTYIVPEDQAERFLDVYGREHWEASRPLVVIDFG